jgi:bacillithiol biosynthesis deacetylase BshB1
MTDRVDVLAVGAHPDDAEMGCGGALLVAAARGHRTGILDLTDGEASTRGHPEVRARERDHATKILGVEVREGLGLHDGSVGAALEEHRLSLVKAIRQLRPKIVLAPYPEDRHPDHAAAGRLAREACFFAGVRRIGEGDPHRVGRLYHYMAHQPFTPSFVLDISDVWERKMEAVRAYASQFGDAGPPATELRGRRFAELLDARASVHGAMIGVQRGEPFHAPGPVGLSTLPGLSPDDPVSVYGMFF